MKKVILSASALMFGAAMFAQSNVSTVDQTGAMNAATVAQTGTMNDSDVEQVGDEKLSNCILT